MKKKQAKRKRLETLFLAKARKVQSTQEGMQVLGFYLDMHNSTKTPSLSLKVQRLWQSLSLPQTADRLQEVEKNNKHMLQ